MTVAKINENVFDISAGNCHLFRNECNESDILHIFCQNKSVIFDEIFA